MNRLVWPACIAILGFVWTPLASAGPSMDVGGKTSQPIGHYEFCRKNPGECRKAGKTPKAIAATSATMSRLRAVNLKVNRSIKEVSDSQKFGKREVWSYPKGSGDCEDFVLEKRRQLMALGFPKGTLLITVVRQRNGEGHSVLTVRTDKGDYVLDNLNNSVKLWSSTGYTYLKRQSESNPGSWVSIGKGRSPVVSSVK